MTSSAEYFRCAPLLTLLRRRECATRYSAAAQKPGGRFGTCSSCPVGRAHALGERHEDAPHRSAPRSPSGAVAASFPSLFGPAELRARAYAENLAAGAARRLELEEPEKDREP